MALPILLLGALACGGGDKLELFVDLRTDLVAGHEFAVAEVFLQRPGTLTPLRAERAVNSGEQFLEPLRIAEFMGLDSGLHRVIVQLRSPTGALVAERPASMQMRKSRVVTIVITRDCRGVMCDDLARAACLQGQCVPDTCTPETPETCPMPKCESPGDCMPATAACAEALCLTGACLLVPRSPAQCATGLYCDPNIGCRTSPTDTPMDGGALDAGQSDDGSLLDAFTSDGNLCPPTQCASDAGALCNPVVQCGCGCDWACQHVWGSTDRVVCAPPGLKSEGELCTNHVECAAGLGCLALLGGEGICTPYCGLGADCVSGQCVFPPPPVLTGFCTQACNLLDGSGCPGSLVCSALGFVGEPAGPIDSMASFCITPGMVEAGESCSDDPVDRPLGCVAGTACNGPPGAGICHPICEVSGTACPMSTVCAAFPRGLVVSGVTYGICL